MTVRINKPALNLREELTKAQGVVRYEQRQFWMDGLVENGTFDNDLSGWTVNDTGGVVEWSSGRARFNTAGDYIDIAQGITNTINNKKYLIMINYTKVTGNMSIVINGLQYDFSSSGIVSQLFTSDGDDYLQVKRSGAGEFFIDDVKVFEVDENDNVIHSVPLGFKPVHVYEDGLLQREGENHDYTVVDTGFGYQIKPTVAPSATTETCVIAEREL